MQVGIGAWIQEVLHLAFPKSSLLKLRFVKIFQFVLVKRGGLETMLSDFKALAALWEVCS